MTTFVLIRHGLCDAVGRYIAGRTPGITLNAEGRAQAKALTPHLESLNIDHIISSPLERARETAMPVSEKLGIPINLSTAFQEIDYGDWTGKSFAELENDIRWKQYHDFRGGRRIPGGEMMSEVQLRAVAEIERIASRHESKTIAVFTHADVIRSVVLHFLGAPLEFNLRLEIHPASVSILEISSWSPRVTLLNHRP